MKVKEEREKAGLNIQKMNFMASSPITSWQIDGETIETVRDFIFLGSKIIADGICLHGKSSYRRGSKQSWRSLSGMKKIKQEKEQSERLVYSDDGR